MFLDKMLSVLGICNGLTLCWLCLQEPYSGAKRQPILRDGKQAKDKRENQRRSAPKEEPP